MADDIAEKLIAKVQKKPPLFDKSNPLFKDTLKKMETIGHTFRINGVRSDISNKAEVCVVMWEAVSLFFFTHTIIYTVKPCLGNHCGIPVA